MPTLNDSPFRTLAAITLLAVACACLASCASQRAEGPPIEDWVGLYPEVVDPARETVGARDLFRARAPDAEQSRLLDAAIAAYVAEDEVKFSALRDQLAADPVGAYWLARTLVLFVVKAREAVMPETDPNAIVQEPVWERPIRHLRAMGPAAVPTIVIDLMRNARADRVELGRELLDLLGPAAFPRWSGMLGIADPRARRRAVEILARWDTDDPAVEAALLEAAKAEDFGVRGAARHGLARRPARLAESVRALESEADPFVRRQIVAGLGELPLSRPVAAALIDAMARAFETDDRRTLLDADAALRRLSGRRDRQTVQAWRAWLSTLR